MSLTLTPFHLEVDPTVLVAVLSMAARAIQVYFPHHRRSLPRRGLH